MELMKLYKRHWVEFSIKAKQYMNEGTCGYGVDGKLGEEPAGPHLLKKKSSPGGPKLRRFNIFFTIL